jgi:CRISPR-associated protein Csb1
LLFATTPVVWELLGSPGDEPRKFDFPVEQARKIYQQSVDEARKAGLPWLEQELILKPSPQLQELVRRSQELDLEVKPDAEDAEEE